MKRTFFFLSIILTCHPLDGMAQSAQKADGKLLHATLREKKDGPAKKKFSTDTPKISAFWKGESLKAGDKLRAVWIAEGRGGLKDAQITEAFVTAYKPDDDGIFSLTCPRGGWPTGDYRVEIYVGSKLAETMKFTIEPGITIDVR